MALRGWRRWLAIAAAVIAALVMILTLAGWGLTRSAWGRDEIRHLVEAQAARVLDGTLTIDGVSGAIVNGVTLSGVRFTHNNRDVVTARSVDVSFSLWSWLRGGREISRVRLVDPVIEITEQHNDFDASRWVRSRPPSGGPPTVVSLPHVEIVNGRLVTSAHENVWRLPSEIRELNGQFALRVGGGTRIDIDRLTFSAPPFRARAVTGRLTFNGDARLEHLRIESDTGAVAVDGRIGPTAPKTIELTAQLDQMDGAVWRVWTPLLETIDLKASGSAKLSGNVDHLAIHSALATTAGKMSGDTLIESSPAGVRVTGDSQLLDVDAQHVTADHRWASVITGRALYSAASSGSPSAWTADVTLTGGPMKAFGAALDRVNGKLRYAANVVTFDTTATAYGASAQAAGTIHVGQNMSVDVTGRDVTTLDPRRLPKEWGFPLLDAELNATAFTAQWTSGRWAVTAALAESRVEGATFASGTTVDVSSATGKVTVTADGQVRSLDAQRMGRATGLTGLDDALFSTDLNGHIKMSGAGSDWKSIDLDATAELVNSRAAGGAALASTNVTYTRRARANVAHVVGSIAGLHPEKIGAPAALASDINGQADVTFQWRDDAANVASTTTARGTLRASRSTIAAWPIARGVITGEWRDGAFTASEAELQNDRATLRGRGRIAITRGDSSATFDVTAADVAAFEPWSGRETHGPATARGDLSGPFDAPRVKGTFESAKIADPTLKTFEQLSGQLDLVFPEWVLDKMRGDLSVKALAWSGDNGKIADNVSAQGVFTTRMHASTAQFAGTVGQTFVQSRVRNADWEKELTVDVETLDARRGTRTWSVEPSSGLLQVTSTHVTAKNVQLSSPGGGRLVIDGQVALSAAESGGDPNDHVSMKATAIDLAAFDEFFGLNTGATGQISGDATLIGRLSDPRGKITIDGHDLSVRGYKIAAAGGTIDLANGAAMTALKLTQPDGVSLTANGRAPLSWLLPAGMLDASVPSPDWDLTAISEPIDLAILGAVSPKMTQIGGQAIVDLKIVGAAAMPSVTGTVAVADGSFHLPSAGTAFSGVTADIGLGLDTITVRRFEARDKHNHQLKVTGQLAINARQLKGVDINVEADEVAVLDNAIGTIELSSLLALNGDLSHPKLSGNLEVASGRIEVDRLLRALQGDPNAFIAETDLPAEGVTPVDLRAAAAAAAAEEKAHPAPTGGFNSETFLSSLAVDVQILAPDNLILRGSKLRPGGKNSWSLGDLNVTVGGDLQATRAPGEPVRLLGDVTTIRGVYSFENRRFEIQRGGKIRFQNELPIDPTFDVRGVRSIQGVEARVDVRGRLSEPSLQLGSNVPLDEADILSMIIFNRPVNQLGDTQRADLVGAAASLAGGYVTSPLAQSLSRALNLDLLEVETVSFGQNVAPRVRVGQQLTSRLFVQLSQQFGAQSLTELTAEYKLANFLRLQGSTAQGAGSQAQRSLVQRVERASLDLLFFFNY